jgi:hypothetical protein
MLVVSAAQTDSARRVFGQSLVGTARRRVPSPSTAATYLPTSTCHTCNSHPCAAPLAGAQMLAPRARQLCDHPPPHGRRCQPAATSALRAAHAATGPAPYSLAFGPEEKPITTLPTVTVKLPPLHSSPPSPPCPSHRRPPPLVLLRPHPPYPIPLPCFLGRAETPRELGRSSEQAGALLWAEPKCTMHFLNYFIIM